MFLPKLYLVVISVLILVVSSEARGRKSKQRAKFSTNGSANATVTDRRGKLFSLFNVVQFRNEPCASQGTLSGGSSSRNGTCLTATQCSDKNGMALGNCAAGFGVCCVFIVGTGDDFLVTENCSYIQNPDFPTPTSTAGAFTYTIRKCSQDVCQLRLDFEVMTIAGITGTAESACTQDVLTITGQTNHRIPEICGENSGQHIYVDAGNTDTSLSLMLGGTVAFNRRWDIKVTQLECCNPHSAPNGCLQYHTSLTGRITTFNFAANEFHLNNQDYSVCVRSAPGFCCVRYSVCSDQTNPFSLDTTPADAMQDDLCNTNDYVGIEGSSTSCVQGDNLSFDSKYCSPFLSDYFRATEHTPICDCTPPFFLDIYTNNAVDNAPVGATITSRGVCLDFAQVPCA